MYAMLGISKSRWRNSLGELEQRTMPEAWTTNRAARMGDSNIYQDHISSSDTFKDVTTRSVTSSGVRERAKI
jgi:hypothetical protein